MSLQQLLQRGRLLYCAPQLRTWGVRNAANKYGRFVDGGTHCTMNDLPVPKGDWCEWYAKRNKHNTTILIAGIVSFIGSWALFFCCAKVPWNYTVPEYPQDEENKDNKENKENKK